MFHDMVFVLQLKTCQVSSKQVLILHYSAEEESLTRGNRKLIHGLHMKQSASVFGQRNSKRTRVAHLKPGIFSSEHSIKRSTNHSINNSKDKSHIKLCERHAKRGSASTYYGKWLVHHVRPANSYFFQR